MGEFTATDAIRPWYDSSLKGRAIRLFDIVTLLLGVLTVAAWGVSMAFGWTAHPLAILVTAVLLLKTGSTLCTTLAIRHNAAIGKVLQKTAFLVFLTAVIGLIAFSWAVGLLFNYVDDMVVAQTPAAVAVRTCFGGELTIADIQTHLVAGPTTPVDVGGAKSMWQSSGSETVAWLLWPFQFRAVRDLLLAFGALGFVALTASFAIWWERKVAGRIQSRLGPMRVGGWHGWAQGIADGLKLIQKEDIFLNDADRPMFKLSPYLVFIPVLAAFAALPFGSTWVFRDLDVGLVFILAMVGIDVIGVILGGWASNNKWSIYGAMREACQMVSYEIPMGMSLLLPVMIVGTLNLTEFAAVQSGGFHTWLAFSNPFVFIASATYCIAALASCKRSPFDLPEAESELVAGFHTEYSGFRWAVFFFGEYAAMFVVSGLAVILFFGAWHSPLPASWGASLLGGPIWQRILHGLLFSGPLWFVAKAYGFLYIQIWMRWTLPRVRIDQVMYACVQVLLPLAMLLLLGNAFWRLFVPADSGLALVGNAACTLVGATGLLWFAGTVAYGYANRRRLVGSLVVDHLPGS